MSPHGYFRDAQRGLCRNFWIDGILRLANPPPLSQYLANKNLENRKGEYIIDNINSVEDTKGNNGDRGTLVVTNLRILWINHKNQRLNLSIGFNTVLTITIKKAKSKLRGEGAAGGTSEREMRIDGRRVALCDLKPALH